MDHAAREKPIERRTPWMAAILMAGLLAAMVSPWTAHASVMLTGCEGAALGADCRIAALIAGGSIQIDNSLFDAWSYDGNGISANAISVVPLGEGTMNPGPGVRLTMPGVADDSVDFELNYDVSTRDSTMTLHDYTVDIAFGQIIGAAGGFAAMEVVDNDTAREIACGGLGGVVMCEEPTVNENDSTKSDIFTDETTGLDVLSKDFNVNTNMMAFSGAGESVEFVVIEQSFSVAVPEPAPALLLMAGALVLLGSRRLRTRSAPAQR